MRGLRLIVAIGSAATIAGCFDSTQKLSPSEEQLLDAATFLFSGLEDNLKSTSGKGMAWQRTVRGRTIEYWRISENSIGVSDEKLNAKIHKSQYVRYVFRISSPKPCSFKFQEGTEFSNGNSKEDFSILPMRDSVDGITFDVSNANTFQFEEDGLDAYLRIVGPRAVCYGPDNCENAWNDVFSPLLLGRSGGSKQLNRRKRALAVIKRTCPGKEF